MSDKKKPNIVEISRLKKKYGNIYKSRDKVEVAIRKLLKQRNQLVTRSKVAQANKDNIDRKQQLLEEKKKAKKFKSKKFDPYSIFYFTYKHPVSNPPIWDIRPLVLVLGFQQGKKGRLMLGVNMHWIDRKYRWTFWNYIKRSYEFLQSYNKGAQLPLLIYSDIKKYDALKPAMKAIRKYYINRIGKIVIIPENDYDKIFVKYKSLKKLRMDSEKTNTGADMSKTNKKPSATPSGKPAKKSTPSLRDLSNSRIGRFKKGK